MNENSDVDTLVGSLTTLDQDGSQKHTFKLLNSASGRFKVDGNKITVMIDVIGKRFSRETPVIFRLGC